MRPGERGGEMRCFLLSHTAVRCLRPDTHSSGMTPQCANPFQMVGEMVARRGSAELRREEPRSQRDVGLYLGLAFHK